MWSLRCGVPQRTVAAISVGGALVPAAVSAYPVIHDHLGLPALLAVAAVAVVARVLARPVHGVGVVLPGLIPPLAAGNGVGAVLTASF